MGKMNRSFSSSPVRVRHNNSINTSLSFSNQDTQTLLNQLLPNSNSSHFKFNDSFNQTNSKTSNSFDFDPTNLVVDTSPNKSLRKKSSSDNDWSTSKTFTHTTSELHIASHNYHLSSSINSLYPVLLTPNAFINSPNTRPSTNQNEINNHQKNFQNTLITNCSSTNSQIISSDLESSNKTNSLTNLPLKTQLSSSPDSIIKPIGLINSPSSDQSLNSNTHSQIKSKHRRANSSSSTTSAESSSSISFVNSGDSTTRLSKSLNMNPSYLNDASLCLNQNYEINNNEFKYSSLESKLENKKKKKDHLLSATNKKSLPRFHETKTDIKSLIIQMNNILNKQREEIEGLKRTQAINYCQFKSMLDASLQHCLNTQQKQHQQQIDNSNLNSSNSSAELQQSVINNLLVILEKLIKDEINKLVKSQFAEHLFVPLREQISNELSEKLKTIENIFKDSAPKLFISKSTIDTLSQSISASLQSSIVNTYRDTFQKLIVPNFEKSCQSMYHQINHSFAKGTQDYLIEFDQLAKQHRKMFDDNKEPLLLQMKQFSEQTQLHSSQIANQLSSNLQQQIETNLRNTNAILQDTIISSVKAIIKEELHLAMHDQQLTLPDRLINQMRQSGTMTPIICHTPNNNLNNSSLHQTNSNEQHQQQDTQLQITQHLKKGQINSAFQLALCAADLNLLENLCELVSPNQAFDPKSKLQQPVILSLIQQLSQDLNSNTELKISYLEEALVNLDLTVPLTIEHTPIVMNQLIIKLQHFIQTHPNENITKQCKMLLLASKSLLNTPKHSVSSQNLLATLNCYPQTQISLPLVQQLCKSNLLHHDMI